MTPGTLKTLYSGRATNFTEQHKARQALPLLAELWEACETLEANLTFNVLTDGALPKDAYRRWVVALNKLNAFAVEPEHYSEYEGACKLIEEMRGE